MFRADTWESLFVAGIVFAGLTANLWSRVPDLVARRQSPAALVRCIMEPRSE